ncbi:hypothetical protein [Xanthomonas translucens]|uniref:hypothetical protein n=1 Tax=Xanthomonas campestris pv. translucens TaxID=343 RepID=UPI0002A7B1F5|nr:hypothetical protein [Xanthomonas translucens]ELQ03948.1 hypothetical protein A989_14532 [Xanthomonas translucens DAR61454]MCT8283793.1 hypothetical protein [Xanthomonas translucens pv. undulosa]MCT8318570.1 hypothetical protein [Xanthomonas translucens pv. undulosa]QSQ57181.1 hypothetical protein ISN37_03995 [Xanthomonas translucens pv. undulosa]UKE40771.1 hypothetical protein KCU58_05895 [Xanthomonas translucens pv. undulosa]
MDFYGYNRAKAIAHCDSLAVGRASRQTDSLRSWNRLRPEHVAELLSNAAADARADARALASLMERTCWRINMQVPTQGKANQLVSNVREVAITAAGREFKLQCTESPSLQLERIIAA